MLMRSIDCFYEGSNTEDATPYTFRVADSFGFSDYPCSSIFCRSEKADSLVQFAALYADKIYINNPFEKYVNAKMSDRLKLNLIQDASILSKFESFAEYGILGFRFSYLALCREHKHRILELEDVVSGKVEEIKNILRLEYESCTAKVMIHPDRGYKFFSVTGDPNLLDHGGLDFLGPLANKAFKIYGFNEIDKKYMIENILDQHIANAASSLADNEISKFLIGGNYLTSRKIESDVLEMANGKAKPQNEIGLSDALYHNLPYLKELGSWKILEFRDYEGEKFQNYRDAVRKALREYSGTADNISDIISDIVSPEINKISSIMKRYSEAQKKALSIDLLMGIGGLSIGFSGLINPTAAAVFASLGGVATLRSLGQKIVDLSNPPKEAYDNDYYFLWGMQKRYN